MVRPRAGKLHKYAKFTNQTRESVLTLVDTHKLCSNLPNPTMLTKRKLTTKLKPTISTPTDPVKDLQGLNDFRMHVSDILCAYPELFDHTAETLAQMRKVYSPEDPEHELINTIGKRIMSTREHRPRLHAEILASAAAAIHMIGAKSVVDVGCGEGLLARALSKEESVKKFIGIDIDERQLSAARAILSGTETPHDMSVEFKLSDEHILEGLNDVDVVTALEVIEHVTDKHWIDCVFDVRPRHIVVSTPNTEFNAMYAPRDLVASGLRHPDHKFEFTRQEFSDWANGKSRRHSYSVTLLPIGPSTLEHGSTAMMAIFTRG
jgi:2-polyprenyl-3-methyl-5-hydroxy-6-metoxy-1,4-benzoquinol methylase